jgi:hypothetical protein
VHFAGGSRELRQSRLWRQNGAYKLSLRGFRYPVGRRRLGHCHPDQHDRYKYWYRQESDIPAPVNTVIVFA